VEHVESPSGPRRLGGTDLEVGAIAYGCWRFAGGGVDEARRKIETALEVGMTLIDTADIYGVDGPDGFGAAEELLGRVLAGAPALRDRMVLATKGGIQPGVPYDQSRAYLTEACESSLRRLGVDHVDLYQVHRPDLLTHPGELAETLGSFVERGLVRHVGVSNFTPAQTRALMAHLDVPLVTTQPEFSALHLDPLVDGTLDLCAESGITPLAWSPLGGGRLGVAAAQGANAAVLASLDRLAALAGVDRTAVALAWVMRHPARPIPIIGTQRPERIRAAAVAAQLRLDRTEWYEVLVAARGEPLP
jgi:predicted oxidoreductase